MLRVLLTVVWCFTSTIVFVPVLVVRSLSIPTHIVHDTRRYEATAVIRRNAHSRHRSVRTTPANEDIASYYNGSKYLHASAAALIFLAPTNGHNLARKWGGSAGFLVAAGICHVLSESSAEGRDESVEEVSQKEDIRRIRRGLLWFSVLGMLAFPGEITYYLRSPMARIIAILGLYSARACSVASILIDGRMLQSARPTLSTVRHQFRTTIRGLAVKDPLKSRTYRNILLLVSTGFLSTMMETIFKMRYLNSSLGVTWCQISLDVSALSRLGMLVTVIYTLKLSAERDELSLSRNILLNTAVGVWATMVAAGQSLYSMHTSSRGALFLALGFPFFVKALKGVLDRREATGTTAA